VSDFALMTLLKSSRDFCSGWGRVNTSTGERSGLLLKASLKEVPLEGCKDIYKSINLSQLPDNLQPTQMCASNHIHSDACQVLISKLSVVNTLLKAYIVEIGR